MNYIVKNSIWMHKSGKEAIVVGIRENIVEVLYDKVDDPNDSSQYGIHQWDEAMFKQFHELKES